MCFDDVKVTERPQRFDGEPRIQRLSFVKEGINSSRDSDEWLVTNPRSSGPVVVRQVRPHQDQYPLYAQPRPQQWNAQQFQQHQQQPRWQNPHPLNNHQQQHPQFRPQSQIIVPPPAPLPPPMHPGFGQPIIHQGNPHGVINVGGESQHGGNGWHRGIPAIEAAPRRNDVRIIQERPRAHMPHRDQMGRRIVRNHSRRRNQEYYDDDDDDDDDSFVRTVESYDSDDSFDPKVRSRSRSRRTKYYN